MKVVTLVVLLLTIVSTTTTTIGAADSATVAAVAGGAANTKTDKVDVGAIIAGNTLLRERQRERERQLEEVVVAEEEEEDERESPCPIEMLDPGNTKCNIEKQDGKVCGYDHVWVGSGCSSTSSGELELELDCQPSLKCTCNLFYDEYWACAADNMSSVTTCPDGNGVAVVVSSELRGTICTPEGSIEIVQEQQPQDGDGGVGSGGAAVEDTSDGDVGGDDGDGGAAVEDTSVMDTNGGSGGSGGSGGVATERPTGTDTTNSNSDSNSNSNSDSSTATAAMTETPIIVTTTTTDLTTKVTATDLTNTTVTTTPTTTTTTKVVVPIEFHGINYNTRKGPDWAPDQERCKTREEIVRDLLQLSKVTSSIRLLSLVDCNQGLLVWSVLNKELSTTNLQKMWLGLWVDNDPTNFINELNALELILMDSTDTDTDTTDTDFSHLLGISVGSEAIYRGDVTIDEAIANLESTKSLLVEYNIVDIPTTIVEIAPIYSNSQQLRNAVDTIMTNTFPFWEAIPIDLAVDNLDEKLSYLVSLPELQQDGKEFILGEHGWPSAGYIDGVGVASIDNQQQYMADSYCYLQEQGWPYYIFTGIDNDWRQEQDPNNTIEGNWGFLEADLSLKSHFVDFTFDCGTNDGITYSFGAIDWSVPELAVTEIVDNNDSTEENAVCGLWLGCEALSGNCCPTSNGDYLGCCRTENFITDTTASTTADDGSSTTTTNPPSSASASGVVVVGGDDVDTTPTDAPTIKATTSTDATTSVTVTETEPPSADTLSPTIIVVVSPTNSPITDAPITAAISKDLTTFSPTATRSPAVGGGGGESETTTEVTTNGSTSGSPWNENENEINGSSVSSAHSTVAVAALTSWTIVLVIVVGMF